MLKNLLAPNCAGVFPATSVGHLVAGLQHFEVGEHLINATGAFLLSVQGQQEFVDIKVRPG